jgi:hypothetical protein
VRGSATEEALSPNDNRALGPSRIRVSADHKPLLDQLRTSATCDQKGTVMHYPVNTDKRVYIIYSLFVWQLAARGDHAAKTSRDYSSETSRTDDFRTNCSHRMFQAGRFLNTM